MTSHEDQRRLWNEEHAEPRILLPMEYTDPSSGVRTFWSWLQEHSPSSIRGVEMGCGKGRNGLWLAQQGAEMESFDFYDVAIAEGQRRAKEAGVSSVHFRVHDATEQWPFADGSFDFGVDCFASSDIEDPEGRAFARDEFLRVLKSGGFLFVFAIADTSEFHAKMIEESPAPEPRSFVHPNGKFEKVYSREELLEFYAQFSLVECELLEKSTPMEFYGDEYVCRNYWTVLQKD